MNVRDPRLSHQTLKVLRVLLEHLKEPVAGSDVAKETGLVSGTLYPILLRLEKSGWVSSEWEELDPSEAGRPRKRLYRLTATGYNKTTAALAELVVPQGRLAWNF